MSDPTRRPGHEPTWPSPHGRIPGWLPAFNRFTKFLLAAGIPLGPNTLVTVRGRKTGVPRTTPIALIEKSGRRWVWAPNGEVQWVRNLRQAQQATITTRRAKEEVRAIELDRAQRVAFFRDTLGSFARAIPLGFQLYRLLDRVDLRHPEEAAEGRAVFELHSIS